MFARVTVLMLMECILFCTSSCEQRLSHNIYINSNSTTGGRDNSTCLTANSSEHPCRTLNYAFSHRADFTSYILFPNMQYNLTEVVPFTNLSCLSFMGINSEVICQQGNEVGLAFVNVSDVKFEGITFLFCAATRKSTSKKFIPFQTTTGNFFLYDFKVALYFYLCENVVMSWVNVSSSPNATGVVMYDTGGNNTVENCTFFNNTVTGQQVGGGGFYVEFTYCIPGDSNCTDYNMQYFSITNSNYSFTKSRFVNNIGNNEENPSHSTYIVPFESNHQAFGRGGGLSLFVKGVSAYNSFSVTDCQFENNTAQWGGGGFVEFHDETGSNVVVFTNCLFMGNKCKYGLTSGTGGGGMRIGHYVYGLHEDSADFEYGNRIELTSCNFTSNHAMYGGGLSISPTLQSTEAGKGREAIVKLTNVSFEQNIGKIGAALHIGKFSLITRGVMITMVLHNCTFNHNTALYADLLFKTNTPHTEGIGALYINQVHTIFEGLTKFISNTNSALAVVGTSVDLTESIVWFVSNTGNRGGAISLLGSAYILVNNNTVMKFVSNTARDKGGAIYNRYVEMDNLKTRTNCFLRHVDPFQIPDLWGALFLFMNNTDQNRQHNNSIHTSSILPCAWAGGNGYIDNLEGIFCWSNWTYWSDRFQKTNCINQVTSDPGNIAFTSPQGENEIVRMKSVPGWDFKLPLSITDDYNNDLTQSVVFSSIQYQKNLTNTYIWGNQANMDGLEYSNTTLDLESLGDRIWAVKLVVEMLPCPPGFTISHPSSLMNNSKCNCSGTYGGKVYCDPISHKVRLRDELWMGRLDDGGKYLVGLCPPGFCKTSNTSFIYLPSNFSSLYSEVCSDGRTGVMCGECLDGYGPAVNSPTYDCVLCTNTAANIAKYVASVYLPLAVLFSILIVFDIRLTTGPANAFILYCQAVTSTFSLGADGQIPLNRDIHRINALENGYKFVYGIFNLEFIENFMNHWCVNSNFNTLTALSLDYGVAVFPLMMIIAVTLCLKLKERCCTCRRKCERISKVAHKLCKWRSGNTTEAILPSFAAFILLSYTKFSLTSSYIIGQQPLVSDDGNSVYPSRVYYAGQFSSTNGTYIKTYFLPSVFVLGFVCIIPVLLLVYPLMLFEWCLSKVKFLWRFYPIDKIHFFLDTFQGCYRNKMRFFAGLYFLFRLTIYAAYLITDTWFQQFITQQIACIIMVALVAICRPYTKENKLFNHVDILIFTNLLILNALSLYLYISSQNSQKPPVSAFVVQYILVFLPLVYMVVYIIWYAVQQQTWLRAILKQFSKRFRSTKYSRLPSASTNSVFSKPEVSTHEEDEALFVRAESTNRYKQVKLTEEKTNRNESTCHDIQGSSKQSSRSTSTKLSDVSQSRSFQSPGSTGYGTHGTTSSKKLST